MKRMQKLIRRPGVSIGTILAAGVWLISRQAPKVAATPRSS